MKPTPLLAASDIAVFTLRDEALHVLLIKRKHAPFAEGWALPGGFLEPDEDLDQCARRELLEETGLSGIYLEQLGSFGTPQRDPRARVISIAYFALVPFDRHRPKAASDASEAGWFAMDNLPPLAFDHDKILQKAHERLKAKVDYSTIALSLMPEKFSLSEVQTVFEVVRGEALDKRNFRKWLLGLDVVEETGEKRSEGAHRPAMLYRAKEPGKVRMVK